MFAKFNTDKALPQRARLRNEMLEPKFAKFSIETADPMRHVDLNDIELPNVK